MKKGLSLLLTVVVALSAVTAPAAARGSSGKSSTAPAAVKVTGKTAKAQNEKSQKAESKKAFKTELNAQKKELQQQKNDLDRQKETLKTQYEALLASGDSEGAASLLESIQKLDQQIQALQTQIKKIINERFMVVKTLYTSEELAQFSTVSDLIAQMYADAQILQAGSVSVNHQIVKFDAPAYIKNGTILVPLRAVAEKVGGDVTWDDATKTVTVIKGDTVIEIKPGSMTALVNGVPVEMNLPATVTCGRTYVPLQLLAEALSLATGADSETGTVDIEDGAADSPSADSADTAAEDTAGNTAAADPTNTEPTTDASQG